MGSLKLLDTQTALTDASTTVDRDEESHGGHTSAVFLLDISAITGTWTVTLSLKLAADLITVASAQFAAGGGTGLFVITADAAFNGGVECIPTVNHITYTEDVAGSLTAQVYAGYA